MEKNHVRLTDGDGHGPRHEYPDDYDTGGDGLIGAGAPGESGTEQNTAEQDADGRERNPGSDASRTSVSADGQSSGEQSPAGGSGESSAETDAGGTQSDSSSGSSAGIVPGSDAHSPSTAARTDGAGQAMHSDESGGGAGRCDAPGCESTRYVSTDVYLERFRERLSADDVEALQAGEIVCLECGGVTA